MGSRRDGLHILVPGITSVSAAGSLAMDAWESWEDVLAEEFPVAEGDPNPLRRLNWITPDYFETLGNRLLAGRQFDWADVFEHRNVAIVSETFAGEYWSTPQHALGRRFRMGESEPWREIIAVAGDILPQTRQAVWTVDPRLPLYDVRTLKDIFAASISRTSFTLVMLGISAGVAVILGMVGVYGVVSFGVAQRRQEMGVRMAMGATSGQVGAMVLRSGATLAGMEMLVGITLAAGLTRVPATLLFGVSPLDPLTFGAVITAVLTVVLLASYLPARRAARVDPVGAMRES